MNNDNQVLGLYSFDFDWYNRRRPILFVATREQLQTMLGSTYYTYTSRYVEVECPIDSDKISLVTEDIDFINKAIELKIVYKDFYL